ncbi:endocuticle structural glycoprotein SgAbd-3-like [Homalodisca vitripennis]|uniref:endocuticle structural glycoprotein SgAbd-3-like n=1 Tax=Homalodisca vitripennis TaxID=197043 RepID=UPI001EEB12A2|nr:endocuticle structural glycoprotein SgAbd-3-like [Homalodisca vitripennis]
MSTLTILLAVVGCSLAAPQFGGRPQAAAPQYSRPQSAAPVQQGSAAPKQILILKQAQELNYDGNFNYGFETENGIASQANGYLKDVGTDNEALVITGSYSYLGEDGNPVVFTYTADENGYQPQSDLIPTPPPVPVAIQKALDYLRSLPPSEEDRKRQ